MSRIAEHHYGDQYPNAPGFKEPTTSAEAARRIKSTVKIAELYEAILTVIRLSGGDGLSADEAAKMLGKSVLLIRPRFTELKHLGKIEKTGGRRRNESGMMAGTYRTRQER